MIHFKFMKILCLKGTLHNEFVDKKERFFNHIKRKPSVFDDIIRPITYETYELHEVRYNSHLLGFVYICQPFTLRDVLAEFISGQFIEQHEN